MNTGQTISHFHQKHKKLSSYSKNKLKLISTHLTNSGQIKRKASLIKKFKRSFLTVAANHQYSLKSLKYVKLSLRPWRKIKLCLASILRMGI